MYFGNCLNFGLEHNNRKQIFQQENTITFNTTPFMTIPILNIHGHIIILFIKICQFSLTVCTYFCF